MVQVSVESAASRNLPHTKHNYILNDYWCNLSIPLTLHMSENEFCTKFAGNKDILIVSLNIQSLQSKALEFQNFLDNLSLSDIKPDVILLQEIWNSKIESYTPPGYIGFSKLRTTGRGGGVGIMVRDSLCPILNVDLSLFHESLYESIVVETTIESKKVFFVSCYKPPNHATFSGNDFFDSFNDLLSRHLELLNSKNCNVFIGADFNINLLKCGLETHPTLLLANCVDHSYNIINSMPTRLNTSGGTLIDHMLTNIPSCNIVATCNLLESPSDHLPNIAILRLTKQKMEKKSEFQYRRNLSQHNIDRFIEALSALSWDEVLSTQCPEVASNLFNNIFLGLFNLYFPLTKVKTCKKKNPINSFMTPGLLRSRTHKLNLEKKAKLRPTADNISRFKVYRNIYNKLIVKAKRLDIQNRINDCNGDSRKMWKIVNEINNKCRAKPCVSALNIDNIEITDKVQIASEFNNFFSKIGQTIKDSVPPSQKSFRDYLPPPQNNSFFASPTAPQDIINCVSSLKSKTSVDINGVSSAFLKKVIQPLAIPISHLFNLSISKGIFPSCFKTSLTIPVFKKGDPNNMDNYRGISLINTFSKIFEQIMADQLNKFLKRTSFFADSQFGFIKNRNTKQALVKIINFITDALNRGKLCLALSLDVTKAFDSVDWEILFEKLKNAGVRGVNLEWFKSYFAGRDQVVKIEDKKSTNKCPITCSVLQGSILGVLCFLVYVNDLFSASKIFNCNLFADDNSALTLADDMESLVTLANEGIGQLVNWYNANKLALHPQKTKIMIFRPRHLAPDIEIPLQLFINYNGVRYQISTVPNLSEKTVKTLGFHIDNKLNFSPHLDIIKGKLISSLYCLKTVKPFLTIEQLRLFYFAHIHSHIQYSSIIFSMANQSSLDMLQILQNKAIRAITGVSKYTNVDDFYKILDIPNINSLSQLAMANFMFEYTKKLLPENFCNDWILNNEFRPLRQLRDDNNFHLTLPLYSSLEKHPLISFPKFWNEIPPEIRSSPRKNVFKKNMKKYIFENN